LFRHLLGKPTKFDNKDDRIHYLMMRRPRLSYWSTDEAIEEECDDDREEMFSGLLDHVGRGGTRYSSEAVGGPSRQTVISKQSALNKQYVGAFKGTLVGPRP
jgi:hypothetical protein